MPIRVVSAFGFILLVTAVHAQEMPVKQETQKAKELLVSDGANSPEQEQLTLTTPNSDAIVSMSKGEPLPDKPQPIVHLGQWIAEDDTTPQFSNDLIMVARKNDGRLMWHVEKVNSCVWCGAPMTWKQAMFDRKASSMWALRSALVVADIEITHHLPCFKAGTCRESNPLVGPTRLQGYSVAAGLTAIPWILDAWARKGSRKDRIGGYRHWWIVPAIGDAASAVGIAANLATWHRR